ncbi:phospholipase A2 inhibitor and Ly6/PLAUR domain-containing protein-like [Thunnus maccoyii]|uniref:phospholipase A2 inhibitor and Ly6/PLAUR domain-containing protein-like n=1 Tax=Thunnus maccoyii TaxID=8240 RepID=UPI001C4CB5F5|nr:phospholipase A2 inhibitor and Ly6/PLAUR domain-containing protein-like [Thunnus maccoyii]
MCITASIQVSSSGTQTQQVLKACASSSLCPTTGSQTYSTSLGSLSAVASVQCCNTDNCNSETLPFPNDMANNSLQCFSCDPITGQCNSQLQCRGEEDRCFQASLTSGNSTFSAFGCASTNMCVAAASLGNLPFLQSAVVDCPSALVHVWKIRMCLF